MSRPYFALVPVRPATTNPNLFKLYFREKSPWFKTSEDLIEKMCPTRPVIPIRKGTDEPGIPNILGKIYGMEGKLYAVKLPKGEFDDDEKPFYFCVIERMLYLCGTCGRLHTPNHEGHDEP